MLYLNILMITFICVYIIDLSGIIDELENIIGKWLKCKIKIPKPFSCSLCSSWWLGLLYIIIMGKFTILNIAFVAFLSFLSPNIYNVLIALKIAIDDLIGYLTPNR